MLRSGLAVASLTVAGCGKTDESSPSGTARTATRSVTSPPVPAGLWPMNGYDAVGSNRNPHAGPFDARPEVVRQYDLGDVAPTSPNLNFAAGKLYVCGDTTLVVLDVETGRRQVIDENIDMHAVWGERAYFSETEPSRLVAASLPNSEEHWSHTGEYETVRYADGSLYAVSNDGTVAAYEADSGSTRWHSSLALPDTYRGVLVTSATVTVLSQRKLATVDRETGDVRWTETPSSGTTFTGPWFASGTVLIGEHGFADGELVSRIHAFDAWTGVRQWQQSGTDTYVVPNALSLIHI